MAAGNCVMLFAGGLVSLTGHTFSAYNIEYLVLRCQHSFISLQLGRRRAGRG